MEQGYEGEGSEGRVATTMHHHLYVMAVLSGSRIVRVLCVWVPPVVGRLGCALGMHMSVVGGG